MDERTVRALIEAGAVKKIHIIAMGGKFRIEVDTPNGANSVSKMKGGLKSWSTLDSAAKWVHSLGIAIAQIDLSKWHPRQRGMDI